MITERNLWVGATAVAVGLLLLMILQLRPERRDRTAPGFDEPVPRPAIWRTAKYVERSR